MKEMFEQSEIKNLMLVDALNLAFRYKNQNAKDFAADYLRTVRSLANSYKAKKVVLLVDFKGSAFRKHKDPGYKTGRKEKYAEQTEEEKLDSKEFFEDFEHAVELCKSVYPVIKLEGVEADDTVAYLVSKLKDKFEHTWIISSDVDLDQLLAENVSRFSFITRKEYTLDNFYEEHKCDTPAQLTCVKVLMGDKGDTVPGISGVGSQRAFDLVRKYGSALNLADAIPIDGKGVIIERINESEELIYHNYEMMDLPTYCGEAIAFPNPDNISYMQEFIDGIS